MRKETVDLLEMMDIPLTKDLKDLLDEMDKWDIYMPEIPSFPEIHYVPEYTLTTDDRTYVNTDDLTWWSTSDHTEYL